MKFTEILEELKKGKKVTREEWEKVKTYRYKYIKLEHGDCVAYLKDDSVRHKGEELTTWVGCVFGCADFNAEDWKIYKEPNKKWQPKEGKVYYLISTHGFIDYTIYDSDSRIDNERLSFGNCFKTREEAQHMLEKIKIINKLRELSNAVIETNLDEKKWIITYDCYGENIKCDFLYSTKFVPFDIYFAAEEDCQKAIETIGEENLKKYYFDVKD